MSVRVLDIKVSDGARVEIGWEISVHYRCALSAADLDHDTVLATSLDDRPLVVVLGSGELLPALDEALVGSKVGGTRRVQIGSADMDSRTYEAISPDSEEIVFEFYVLGAVPVGDDNIGWIPTSNAGSDE